ncbi:MAG TPA: hypothetical protein DEH22_06440 [Chloroflexi bacterium]|nr:hypothetical protein [Chloroflexota bacterium]
MNPEIHTTPAAPLGGTSPAAEVRSGTAAGTWHLEIPPGPAGRYRLAQLDDYTAKKRTHFPHTSPLTLRLRARLSAAEIPGTWGFGLWNDPFSFSLGLGGGQRRFPALPNAAWFFGASPQNYLSFRDDRPASGFSAQTFRAAHWPAPLLALGAAGFPALLWPRLARALRPGFRRLIAEESFALEVDPTQWHTYTLDWGFDGVTFGVDDQTFFSGVSPKPPLGLVIWLDNQFVAFPPSGKIAYGTLENPQPTWLKIEAFSLKSSGS